jgi:hypothetical protein
MNKVEEVVTVVMHRKSMVFDEREQKILAHVFEETKQFRNY